MTNISSRVAVIYIKIALVSKSQIHTVFLNRILNKQ